MEQAPYEVVDARTGAVVSTHNGHQAAYRAADRRDRAYGAVRYIVRPAQRPVAA